MKSPQRNLHNQQGMGFIMLIFVFAVCAVVLMLGLKLFPVYSQLFNVKSVFKAMAASEEVKTGTVADIRKSFEKRATIGYVEVITKEDLEITKEGGETVVTAAWQEKIPLFTGYTLVVDLSVSTADK
ncbi:MAG: DUF4845 domain-containing protein [Betaproteobacteria bacterium]|nr:DUF4845 domain-containing protein [Betaproteobacteria bacterium]